MPLPLSFQPNDIAPLHLPESDAQFLLTTGLPEDGIPFLSFVAPKDSPLRSVGETWGVADSLKPSLMRYYEFGFDGGGNPICFDANDNGKIVWLDHEDKFRPVWVNDHLTEFVDCLAILQAAFDAFERAGGDTDAVWEQGFDAERYETLMTAFARIDPKTCTLGFWSWTLDEFRPRGE